MRLLRRAALLSLVLLCAAVESPHRPPAAQATPPPTMHGVYRYRVRGLTAGAGLFSTMLFKVQGMGYATLHRVVPGFFKILSGMAKVSNDPSTKEMHDFLRSADRYGLDLSTIPISAGYGIEIEFTLELVKKEWQLKRGSYRWSSDHHFSVSAGEGSIVENVRGQGSGALDPKTSSITLTTTGKKGDLRQELAGDVLITSGSGAGKSVFTNGPIRWAFDHGTGMMEIVLPGLAGVRQRLVEPGENMSLGQISFSKSRPGGGALRGREVYQDLLDSGVVEEWELWGECEAWIDEPADNAELVFDDKKPGRLVYTAYAGVRPTFWEDDLHWDLPQLDGTTLDTPPEKANGNDFPVTYTNLPEKNSAFKLTEVKARFDTDRAKRAGCKDPQQSDVGYFFRRNGLNHGGPPGFKSDDNPDKQLPNPNWFYYWMQTRANRGLPDAFVRYGAEEKDCTDADGYYSYGRAYIVVCDMGDFVGWNPLAPGYNPDGIDWFANTLLHEKQHYDNYRRWWSAGWDPLTLDTDGKDKRTKMGREGWDGDLIPDLLERSVPVPPEVKVPPGIKREFNPNKQDSFGYGIEDEHYLAWAAGLHWKLGWADAEDWSCPGHQTFTCGQ